MIAIKNLRGSILLLVVSVLLILSFGSYLLVHRSILASKILTNQLENADAFSIAEEALLKVERNIIPTISIEFFNSNCIHGYCFSGSNKEFPQSCTTSSDSPWSDIKYWESEANHQQLNISFKDNQVTAKYIIEFLCYMPRNIDGPLTDYNNLTDMAMIFRITVLGINNNGAESMLQSVYKRDIL